MTLCSTLVGASEVAVFDTGDGTRESGPTTGAGWQLAYEFHGDRSLPLVLVLGGISAGRHVASHPGDATRGWWEALVHGAGGLGLEDHCLLGVDYVGGAGQSGWGEEPRESWTPRDQAGAIEALRLRLGLPAWHACIGASYGGMVGLALAERHPGSLARLVVLSAPAASHPQASAWRDVQRGILELGLETGREREAVALARALAMVTYRTAEEFASRFPTPWPGTRELPIAAYLRAHGRRFAEQFPARAFLALSRSADAHWVDPSRISVPTTLWGSTTDRLVPPSQLEELAGRLPALRRLVLQESPFGHDAFLKETDAVAAVLRQALEEVR